MNRRISVVWAGVAVTGIFAVSALIYAGGDIRILLHPVVVFLLLYAGLLMVWYMIMRYEKHSKVRDFVVKYRIIQIVQVVLLLAAVILYFINSR